MKFYIFSVIFIFMAILTIGAVGASDNSTQDDLSDILESENSNSNIVTEDNGIKEGNEMILKDSEDRNEISYDNRYYMFRGDSWTVSTNFESSAAVTSKSLSDFTVTGTFRTQNDIVGIYWNSQDPIQHPYISYGSKCDYSDVILEFDYEMDGCMDFSNDAVNLIVASNGGETYYIPMDRFIEAAHVTLDFTNLTLLADDSYFDKNGQPVTVSENTRLDTSDLKYVMLSLLPTDFAQDNNKYVICENADFTCRISNISVLNGFIAYEQVPLEPHQYRICEGYDDIYNLNPFRLAKEMRKLGYVDWVDLYIGASYFYEKSGTPGDLITDMGFNHNRTEKMVLNNDVALNKAFKSWLDCYSRELKSNGVDNLIISVSMENLQCPQSWRQTDSNGNFAMTGWSPSTFFLSPCNDEAVTYMQKVSQACLDIIAGNGFDPILQMGETWWWWNEIEGLPYFYDNSTRFKYLAEHGSELPVYDSVWAEYDDNVIKWLNHQLVQYSDCLREVVKGDRYDSGLYLALFFPPSVTDDERVSPMMRDANYIKDAYSPLKLDMLQIEDYDWVIFESTHHSEAYTIGQELGFSEDLIHYFGGFVQNPEDADRYWELIKEAMDDALAKNFSEVFVWAGSQVRRDSKILGYDEDELLDNLSPVTVTSPDFVSVGENFTVKVSANDWVNGVFNVYEYNNGKKGELLVSNELINGSSSVHMSSGTVGVNRFYLDLDSPGGEYHLIVEVNVIENSKNITVDISPEIEKGAGENITFRAPKSSPCNLYISFDENDYGMYSLENGEFTKTLSDLPAGYHSISLKYSDGKLNGDAYSNTFMFNVGFKTAVLAEDLTTHYNSNDNLVMTLKDSEGNLLNEKNIFIRLNGSNHTVTTDDSGKAKFAFALPIGNYSAEIFFNGSEGYLPSSAGVNITVNRAATVLTAGSVSVVYGNAASIIFTLKDEGGKVLAGQKVVINLNNKVYNRLSDSKGRVKLTVGLAARQYSVKASFKGDGNYRPSSRTSKIVVKKATPKFSAKNISFKAKTKTKKYAVILKNNRNKVMKKVKITLKVKGKTFKAITNSKGKATFKITKLTKKGKFAAYLKYAGSSNYRPLSKKIIITVK